MWRPCGCLGRRYVCILHRWALSRPRQKRSEGLAWLIQTSYTASVDAEPQYGMLSAHTVAIIAPFLTIITAAYDIVSHTHAPVRSTCGHQRSIFQGGDESRFYFAEIRVNEGSHFHPLTYWNVFSLSLSLSLSLFPAILLCVILFYNNLYSWENYTFTIHLNVL